MLSEGEILCVLTWVLKIPLYYCKRISGLTQYPWLKCCISSFIYSTPPPPSFLCIMLFLCLLGWCPSVMTAPQWWYFCSSWTVLGPFSMRRCYWNVLLKGKLPLMKLFSLLLWYLTLKFLYMPVLAFECLKANIIVFWFPGVKKYGYLVCFLCVNVCFSLKIQIILLKLQTFRNMVSAIYCTASFATELNCLLNFIKPLCLFSGYPGSYLWLLKVDCML